MARNHLFLPTHVFALTLLLVLAGGSAADIYRYRDPTTGRLIISNTPPPAGAETQTEMSEGLQRTTPVTPAPPPSRVEPKESSIPTLQRPQKQSQSRGDSDDLEFVESTNYRRGNYHYIKGVVRNRSQTATMTFVKITVKLYDRWGDFVGMEDTYTSPTHLAPGQEGTYDLMFRPPSEFSKFRTSASWRWK
jgi:hypothetical protein